MREAEASRYNSTGIQTTYSPQHATLGAPATEAEITALEAEFQLALPAELRQWFQWRNGQQGFENYRCSR